MFVQSLLREAHLTRGLIFVDADGFQLLSRTTNVTRRGGFSKMLTYRILVRGRFTNFVYKNNCMMITDHEEVDRWRSWDDSIVTNAFSRGGIHAWSIKAVVKPEVVTFGAGIVKY